MALQERNDRKTYVGEVVSNKMDNTVVVRVTHLEKHPRYKKVVKRAKKFYAHHDGVSLQNGDLVLIAETRPISKLKRWRVVEKAEGKEQLA